jgi:hypothetical protein
VFFKEDKNHLSGTLTVTDGTHTGNLKLLGQDSAQNFSLSSDGHGGTIIVDPAVGSGGRPYSAFEPWDRLSPGEDGAPSRT